jgi:hypothetical protein
MEFSPALSPRAEVLAAEINGRPVSMRVERNSADQHVVVRFPVNVATSTVHLRLRNDFGYSVSSNLPPLGERSQGLRILSESWGPNNESLTVNVSAIPGKPYELFLWNPAQVASVEGAKLIKEGNGESRIRIELPGADVSSYVYGKLVIQFGATSGASKSREKHR